MRGQEAELFLLGLLSLIDAILDRPMPEIITQLAVSEEIKLALLHGGGRFDLPAFFGPPITGEQRQSAWLSRSRVLLDQREPASPASAHRHPSQHGAAL